MEVLSSSQKKVLGLDIRKPEVSRLRLKAMARQRSQNIKDITERGFV